MRWWPETAWVWELMKSPSGVSRRGNRDAHGLRTAGLHGLDDVPAHHAHAGEVEQAAAQADHIERPGRLDALDEGVDQGAVRVDRAPHQALHHAGDPHRGDVEHDAQRRDPEVQLDGALGVHLRAAEHARDQVVERTDGDQAHPAQRAAVHMAHGPVGVVRQRIDRLDRHHRALEGRHAVERQRHDQELQDGVVTQLVPGARQRHHAVDHAAPARRQQHQAEDHADALRPVRQGRVMQVVGARPHIGEDQRPEVDDGQPVAVDRALGLLGDVVVHDPEEAGRQEEADRVMAVPPLHHRVLHAGIGRVALPEADRDLGAVDDVQQGHRDDEGAEEPVGHVDVPDLASADGAEEHDRIRHPDHGDQQVDRPLEFGVFLAGGVAQRQRDRGQQDDELPAPEREPRQLGQEEPGLAGALHDVVAGREQRAAAERKNDRVGMQRSQAAIAEPGNAEVEVGPGQLGGNDDAHQHAHHPPQDGRQRKRAHRSVLVCRPGGGQGLVVRHRDSFSLMPKILCGRCSGGLDLHQAGCVRPPWRGPPVAPSSQPSRTRPRSAAPARPKTG
mmetsp:Transcript_22328/g.88078  ORF Transcript_22328/g.88078 Transcript_22328/m.88078 type:complete len:559 (+) Transcript_22328:2076-3752(+)